MSDFDKIEFPEGLSDKELLGMMIGYLITTWSQAESTFRTAYCCLLGVNLTIPAETTWFALGSNFNRLKTLRRILAPAELSDDLKSQIKKAVRSFEVVSKARNFYAHAGVKVNPTDLKLLGFEGYNFDEETGLYDIAFRNVKDAKAHIRDALREASRLCRGMLPLLRDLKQETGAHFLELPEPPPGYEIPGAFRP